MKTGAGHILSFGITHLAEQKFGRTHMKQDCKQNKSSLCSAVDTSVGVKTSNLMEIVQQNPKTSLGGCVLRTFQENLVFLQKHENVLPLK